MKFFKIYNFLLFCRITAPENQLENHRKTEKFQMANLANFGVFVLVL